MRQNISQFKNILHSKSFNLNFGIILLLNSISILLLSFPSFAQMTDMKFEHILSDKGLSQNTIHCIIQDREGFLWFATEDGLDKYDGYDFKIYKNDVNDSTSISDNFIWTMFEDKSGTLWIGTNSGGLSKFNRDKDNFTNYKHIPGDSTSLSNDNVRSILEDNNGNLWVGTEAGGLNEFNRKTNKFTQYHHEASNPNSLSNEVVLSVYIDNSGTIWAGTNDGLNKFNAKTKKFTSFLNEPGNPNSLSSNVVLSILEDKNSMLWVGTLNGLNKFDRKTRTFKRFLNNPNSVSNLSDSRINSIIEDRTGTLWVGTGNGLFQFNRTKQKFMSLERISPQSSTLNKNNILSLYEDNAGLVWVGTAEGGIVKFDRERMKFKHFKHISGNSNSLSYNTVRSIYQDKSGVLWIGTLGGGLNRFDKKSNKFIHIKHKPGDPNSLSENSVTSIFKDKKGTLWVGTWGGGLNKLVYLSNDGKIQKFISYQHNPDNPQSISSNVVQAIYKDSDGRMWIGTGAGLDLFDPLTGKFNNFTNTPGVNTSISDNQIQSAIFEDKSHYLWIGTWGGLNRIDLSKLKGEKEVKSLKFHRFTHKADNPFSLSDNRVISIHQDKHGNLWFGTYGGGLNELPFDQEHLKSDDVHFISYSIKDGLASNIIYGILEDKAGNLWLSTDNGLSKFDPENKTFRNYYQTDGLQSNQFYWGASYRGLNGELFFGGTNGVNAFYPSKLKDNKHIPPIVITSLQIFNKQVKISSENSPLTKSITETKKIELSYNQNVFSIEFAALDFTAPKKNQYKYMMEGFDKNWINAGNRRFVTYTNLDPGNYTFKVIGSNNDGVWNKRGTSLEITILPPFWKTWWFILAAVLILGGLIAFVVIYRVKHLLDIERFRAKLAADLHDNIGSSLTEISILSEVITQKLNHVDTDVKKSLKMISNNSRNLIDNMSDIVWLVNPKRDSLYDLILRLRDTYTELSSYTSISFRSENLKSLEKISLTMEHRQHLYLIFKEGINNCITHSECTEISLDAFVKGKRLEMILKDNGKGFNREEIGNGNGLGNITERARSIGGHLEIDSKIGEGTTIHFIGNLL